MQGLKMDSWLAGLGGWRNGEWLLTWSFLCWGGGDDVLDRSDGHTAL